jgi:hypothetical protein
MKPLQVISYFLNVGFHTVTTSGHILFLECYHHELLSFAERHVSATYRNLQDFVKTCHYPRTTGMSQNRRPIGSCRAESSGLWCIWGADQMHRRPNRARMLACLQQRAAAMAPPPREKKAGGFQVGCLNSLCLVLGQHDGRMAQSAIPQSPTGGRRHRGCQMPKRVLSVECLPVGATPVLQKTISLHAGPCC